MKNDITITFDGSHHHISAYASVAQIRLAASYLETLAKVKEDDDQGETTFVYAHTTPEVHA